MCAFIPSPSAKGTMSLGVNAQRCPGNMAI
uniref:Uncharacterized protein n=1 Tax=Anguilla anguilla TaxID=7936 RepID=A0A0E9T532_ANGAN